MFYLYFGLSIVFTLLILYTFLRLLFPKAEELRVGVMWVLGIISLVYMLFWTTVEKEKIVTLKITSSIVVDCNTGNINGSTNAHSILNMYTDLSTPNRLVSLERNETTIIRSHRNVITVVATHHEFCDWVKDIMKNDPLFSEDAMCWPFDKHKLIYGNHPYSWTWNYRDTDQKLYTDKLTMF